MNSPVGSQRISSCNFKSASILSSSSVPSNASKFRIHNSASLLYCSSPGAHLHRTVFAHSASFLSERSEHPTYKHSSRVLYKLLEQPIHCSLYNTCSAEQGLHTDVIRVPEPYSLEYWPSGHSLHFPPSTWSKPTTLEY